MAWTQVGKKRNWYAGIGSISEGTLRTQDLLESFIWEASHLRLTKDERKRVSAIRKRVEFASHSENIGAENAILETHTVEEGFDIAYARACNWTCSRCGYPVNGAIHEYCGADADLEELTGILENHALPYFYFGTSEGDGASFGFWLDSDFENSFDGLKVSDTSEIPAGYTGEVLLVNERGNMTLYNVSRGKRHVVWSIV